MDILKSFTSYFKEKAAPMIKLADSNRIILPFNKEPLCPVNNDEYLNQLTSSFHSSSRFKLTPRQLQCAQLILNGQTIKEISTQLNLSHRTIETYINNIKSKLYCKNKTELIIKLTAMLKTKQV